MPMDNTTRKSGLYYYPCKGMFVERVYKVSSQSIIYIFKYHLRNS